MWHILGDNDAQLNGSMESVLRQCVSVKVRIVIYLQLPGIDMLDVVEFHEA